MAKATLQVQNPEKITQSMITDKTEISPGNSSRVADRKRGIAELGSMAAASVE